MEKLPYFAYMLKKNTPRKVCEPAPACEIFTFAKNPNWKCFQPMKDLIKTYDRCLRRIRSSKRPAPSNSKKKDIDRILMMRDQENAYDSDSLYTLFTKIDSTRIKTIRNALKSERWHFMKPEQRITFLAEYLPEEEFREYDDLFADFRMGGYRMLGDIICDIDDANRNADKDKLHFKNDTADMTAMINAYINQTPGTDYREAITTATLFRICKIMSPFMAIRYAEALGRRDFIFDVMLETADHYLV